MNETQLLWCLLNVEEDYKEKSTYTRDVVESVLPWINPQMYSKMKEYEKAEEESDNSEYEGYVEELKQHGVSEEDIRKFINLEKRSKMEKEARQKDAVIG